MENKIIDIETKKEFKKKKKILREPKLEMVNILFHIAG